MQVHDICGRHSLKLATPSIGELNDIYPDSLPGVREDMILFGYTVQYYMDTRNGT